MKLLSESFRDGQPIPGEFAFCVIDAAQHVRLSSNHNPQFTWDDVPPTTRSFAITCVDPLVPSKPDDVNKEDREIPSELPRVDFFHWTLIDIPASTREIAAGSYSKEVTPRGKAGPATASGARQGINDYTGWFASDHDMSGDYFGYDGPCPPWNDSIVHRYVFTIYALDVETVDISGRFSGPDVVNAMKGHILAQASLTGTYTLNPRLAA